MNLPEQPVNTKTSTRPWLWLCTIPLLILWGISYLATAPQSTAHPDNSAPLCRYGVNAAGDITQFDTTPLRIGWYIDYRANANPTRPNGAIYAPMVRLSQVRVNGERTDDYTYRPAGNALQQAIAGNPGANWIIGNEPDRIEVQDDVEPHVYAAAYHELYHLIKTADPTAKIVAGTIVQPTPVRLTYLDKVLVAYLEQFGTPMPVDAWNIHNFILNEVSCDYDETNCWGAGIPPGVDVGFGEILGIDDSDNLPLFKERIVRFRQWMKARGYGHLPLYLTEYGVLMPEDLGFDAARVNAFMNGTYDYMETAIDPALGYPGDNYRLVQKWSWFSTFDAGFNGNLYNPEPPFALTPIGENFAGYTAVLPPQTDLYPWQFTSQATPQISNGQPVTLTLRVNVANSGNLATLTPPTLVRFYNGDPRTGGTQIGTDQSVSLSGCGQTSNINVDWPNVSHGTYTIYVWVDPLNTLAETNEENNLQSFTLLVADPTLYLPLLGRATPTP